MNSFSCEFASCDLGLRWGSRQSSRSRTQPYFLNLPVWKSTEKFCEYSSGPERESSGRRYRIGLISNAAFWCGSQTATSAPGLAAPALRTDRNSQARMHVSVDCCAQQARDFREAWCQCVEVLVRAVHMPETRASAAGRAALQLLIRREWIHENNKTIGW